MTDLMISRGDTFPRTFLYTYRANRVSEQFGNDLVSSKSDELVLQNSALVEINDIYHGHSENLLDITPVSPTKHDFLDLEKPTTLISKSRHHKNHRHVPAFDNVDPEDSIRDMVSDNDFYKFVLFKKHYDKYLHLSQRYEEARNIAYYLEEKYHEVKTERDDLIKQRDELTKLLESNDALLREKEDEVFLQFERVVYLEEQCDKLKAEKERFYEEKELIEQERNQALKILQHQAKESEYNRRKLERARQEVVHCMTKIKNEKDHLEKENDNLKEALEAERKCLGDYLDTQKRLNDHQEPIDASLASHFHKAVQHLATCRRKKCLVCTYTKSTYRKMENQHQKRYDHKLFGCLQTPFLEMKNLIKPPPSPIHGGESLSEWFCHLTSTPNSDCTSLSVPFAELSISYMDDESDTSSNYFRDVDGDVLNDFSQVQCTSSNKGFGSDSGFSSDICGEYRNATSKQKEKFCPHATLDEADCAKLTRTKWTSSFRKLIRRLKKQ